MSLLPRAVSYIATAARPALKGIRHPESISGRAWEAYKRDPMRVSWYHADPTFPQKCKLVAVKNWGDRWGSNPQPLDPQSRALPIELRSPCEARTDLSRPLSQSIMRPTSTIRLARTEPCRRVNKRAVTVVFVPASALLHLEFMLALWYHAAVSTLRARSFMALPQTALGCPVRIAWPGRDKQPKL